MTTTERLIYDAGMNLGHRTCRARGYRDTIRATGIAGCIGIANSFEESRAYVDGSIPRIPGVRVWSTATLRRVLPK